MNSHTSSSNFHNYFPWCLPRWTIPNPCVSNPHPAGPSPQMFPMPGTGSWRQERVRGIHLSVEELIKITPALTLLISTPYGSRRRKKKSKQELVEMLARTHRPGRPGWPLRWSRLWKCSSEKGELPVMTMTASFLSNINIPAGSLFSPRGKAIVPLWKLSVKAWNLPLIFFPSARLFACIQVTCQPVTSSSDGLIPSEQRSKQLSRERWERACLFHKAPPQRRIFSQPRPRQRFWHLHQSESETLIPEKIGFFPHIPAWNETHLVYVRTLGD